MSQMTFLLASGLVALLAALAPIVLSHYLLEENQGGSR